MENQARQELELWQIVSSSENKNTQSRPRKQSAQSQRPNSTRNADQIRLIDTNIPRTGNRSAVIERTNISRTSVKQSAQRTVRPNAVETRPARPRASAPRTSPPRTNVSRTSPPRTNVSRTSPSRTNTSRTNSSKTRAGVKIQSANKKKAGRRSRIYQCMAIIWIALMSAVIVFMGKAFYQGMQKSPEPQKNIELKSLPAINPVVNTIEKKPEIREDFLTISEYNRPGTKLASVKNIFVHYTANQGTSAAQNRSYFENLGITHERAASAHFIIGYEGEIVQCIPLEEEAYAVVERNVDSISIECCYLAEDGSFTQETYDSLVAMLAWLTDKYHLKPQDILRHYDCGGKLCPIYYVEHEDAWQQLLDDVEHYTL